MLLVVRDGEVDKNLITVSEGYAIEATIAYYVDPLWRQGDAFVLMTVVGAPQLIGNGMQGHPHDVAHARGENTPSGSVRVKLKDDPPLESERSHMSQGQPTER